MRKILEFWSRNAGLVMSLLFGCLLGLVMGWLLGFGSKSGLIELLGSIIAAGASVSGAMLVVNRQLLADRLARDLDSNERGQRELERREELRKALGLALYANLVSLNTLVGAQLVLLGNGEINGKSLKTERDYVDWCARMELLPTTSFDRFSTYLIDLGDIAPSLLRVYSETMRLKEIFVAQRETRQTSRECVEFAQSTGRAFQQLGSYILVALTMLSPYKATD